MAKNKRSYSSLSNTENDETIPTSCEDREKERERNYLSKVFYYLNKTIKLGSNLYGIYLLWILLHYFASHLYIEYCVPKTWTGLVISPFLTATPHCQGLRWMIYNGGNQINQMWIMIGSWICVKLIF
jgi:hypothetical protein